MQKKASGFILAALAAAFYGTNPIFALPLYRTGLSPVATLFFRYWLGLPFLLPLLFLKEEESLKLTRNECLPTIIVAILMAASSYTLYEAYLYIGASIASTLLFMYPVLTALIMCLFFREKLRISTIASLALMCAGLYLLSWTGSGEALHPWGLFLVFISSLTYAIYLVLMRVSPVLAAMPPLKSLFWQLLFGGIAYAPIWFATGAGTPTGIFPWSLILGIAFLPTIISLLFTLKAIAIIGPTATAILGALEPVTAVTLSSLLLGESLTARELCGGALIILATLLVVANPNLERLFFRKNSS